MTIKYRVTMTNQHGKRIATNKYWESKRDAQIYADLTNNSYYYHTNARVVKDSERIRRMIP